MSSGIGVSVEDLRTRAADGDKVVVFVELKNFDSSEVTDTITLKVDGNVEQSEEVTLLPRETDSLRLGWTVSVSGHNPGTPVTVESSDHSDSTEINLLLYDDVTRVRVATNSAPIVEYVGSVSDIGPGT